MDKKTLAALKGSIKKWEGIVAGTTEDKGLLNCDLCGLFYHKDCARCPVKIKTGEVFCYDSPYIDWASAFREKHNTSCIGRKARDDETVMCAVLELEFLKSLLPK